MASLLARKARAWRRQYMACVVADGAARLACAAVLALSAAVWLDAATAMPQRARWALLAAGCCSAVAGLWRWLARPWARAQWAAVFGAAEARFPELRLRALSAWELSRGKPPPGTSRALREAHLRDAESRLAQIPDEPLFRWRPSVPLCRALAAAALAALSLLWAPVGGVDRVLRPWRDVRLERFVLVTPGDARAQWARPVTIAALWLPGAPAARADLALWLRQDGRWRRAVWDNDFGSPRRFTVSELTAPLDYRLSWRDLNSRVYTLTPVLAPRLESVLARLSGPEPAEVAMTPAEPLSVVGGTLVTVSGRANQALSRAQLLLSSLPQAISMRLVGPGLYGASFIAQENASLRFDLETPDGRGDPGPASYTLNVVADQPPVIELLSPLEPLLASPADFVAIAYSAKDDGGLSRISLLVRPAGQPVLEVALQQLSGKREFAGDHALALGGLPLGELELQLKAVDNATPPHSSLSAKVMVNLQDLQAQHARSQRLWEQAERSLKAASETARRLSEDLAAGKTAQTDMTALPRQWGQATEDLSALAQAMAQDAYANPGLAEDVLSVAEGLSKARQRELPAAQQAAREAAMAQAAQRYGRLARRLESARGLLARGRDFQSLEDFYQQAGRLSEAGAAVESSVDSLARGAKPSSETRARLDEALGRVRRQLAELERALQSLPRASADFANRRVIDVPVQSARAFADELAHALSRGDYEQAARLALRLSQELSKIQQALGQAAGSSAAAALPRLAQQRLERALSEWSHLADEQGQLIERTQQLEDAKLARLLNAQRRLLAELSRRQQVALSSAAAQKAFPAEALAQMRGALLEFEARKVERAAELARGAAGRALQTGFSSLASEQSAIAEALEGGVAVGGGLAGPEAEQEGRDQAALYSRAGRLAGELEALEAETGASAADALDALSSAQQEQAAAAEALGRRDSAGALPRQQKALEFLAQGSSHISESAASEQQRRQRLLAPFQSPAGALRVVRGGRAGRGAEVGFVPLPSAKDYLPPKELREELERSLRESRPSSQDALIKEYFKRIAQ